MLLIGLHGNAMPFIAKPPPGASAEASSLGAGRSSGKFESKDSLSSFFLFNCFSFHAGSRWQLVYFEPIVLIDWYFLFSIERKGTLYLIRESYTNIVS